MKVIKFGQSTLKDKESIISVLKIVSDESAIEMPVVVVSSFHGVLKNLSEISKLAMVGDNKYKEILQDIENQHFNIVKQFVDVKRQAKVIAGLKVILNDLEEILYGVYLLWELSPRTRDHIKTFGVKLSAYLLAECLKEKNINAVLIDSTKIIKTNDNYGNAAIEESESKELIKQNLANKNELYVITGGIGSTLAGESSYLGKSGSAAVASLIANVLQANEVLFYTDRDGIYNTEPALVEKAFSLESVTYSEIMEMSNFGNSFVYPPSIQPLMAKKIPLIVRNLYNLGFKGTRIVSENDGVIVKANSAIQHISLINVQGTGMIGISGIAARVFNTLAQNNINVVLITQASSEHSICLAVEPNDGTKGQIALQNEFMEEIKSKKMENISLTKELSIIAVIGENMKKTPGIAGKIFSSFGDAQINVIAIAQGSSEYNISIVVEQKDLKSALNTLQKKLF